MIRQRTKRLDSIDLQSTDSYHRPLSEFTANRPHQLNYHEYFIFYKRGAEARLLEPSARFPPQTRHHPTPIPSQMQTPAARAALAKEPQER